MPAVERARLTRADGRVEELAHARVERDTLRAELYYTGRGRFTVAVPVDSVRHLEVRRFSVARTAALGFGLGMLLAVMAVVLTEDWGL